MNLRKRFWPRACEARPISYYVHHYHYHHHHHHHHHHYRDYPFWKLVVISLNDDVIYEHDQSWFINWENFSLIIFFYEKIFLSGRKIISIILIDWNLLWNLEIQSIRFLRRGTLTIYELKDYLMFRQTVSELKDYLILIELDDKIWYKFGRNAINELAVT